jgi:putative heme iron utilization protein
MTFRDNTEPAEMIRALIRSADRACLSTGLADPDGGTSPWPFGSLVMLACDHDATPILLMSDLSEHSKNLARDRRASLLIDGTVGLADALTGPRVTLLGEALPDTDPVLRRRYLSRHPRAGFYAGFADFQIYRFALHRAHLVAGFGKVRWVEPAAIQTAAPWRDREPALLERFAERAAEIAARAGLPEAAWQVVGVDPDGIDLRTENRVGRLCFPESVGLPDEIAAFLADHGP